MRRCGGNGKRMPQWSRYDAISMSMSCIWLLVRRRALRERGGTVGSGRGTDPKRVAVRSDALDRSVSGANDRNLSIIVVLLLVWMNYISVMSEVGLALLGIDR